MACLVLITKAMLRSGSMAIAQPLAPLDQVWLDSMKSTIEEQTPEDRALIQRRAAFFARELAEVEAGRRPSSIERKAS
jgi:hypothetical protein